MYLCWQFHGGESVVAGEPLFKMAGAWGSLLTSLDLQAESLAWKWNQATTLEALLPAPKSVQPDSAFQRFYNVSKQCHHLGTKCSNSWAYGDIEIQPQQYDSEGHIYLCMCVACAHVCILVSLCLCYVHMYMLSVCVYAYIWCMCVCSVCVCIHACLCVCGLLFMWVHVFVSMYGDPTISLGIILDYSLPY